MNYLKTLNLLNCITLGDCLPILKALPDKCVDLLLTDPPYGGGATNKAADAFSKVGGGQIRPTLRPLPQHISCRRATANGSMRNCTKPPGRQYHCPARAGRGRQNTQGAAKAILTSHIGTLRRPPKCSRRCFAFPKTNSSGAETTSPCHQRAVSTSGKNSPLAKNSQWRWRSTAGRRSMQTRRYGSLRRKTRPDSIRRKSPSRFSADNWRSTQSRATSFLTVFREAVQPPLPAIERGEGSSALSATRFIGANPVNAWKTNANK